MVQAPREMVQPGTARARREGVRFCWAVGVGACLRLPPQKKHLPRMLRVVDPAPGLWKRRTQAAWTCPSSASSAPVAVKTSKEVVQYWTGPFRGAGDVLGCFLGCGPGLFVGVVCVCVCVCPPL